MIDRRLSGKHVLLLEDEEAILVPTARYFRALGCTVDTASGPDEAEAFVGERRYDLAILDLRVTRFGATEGLDVLRIIKRQAHAADTRVILLSAYVSTDVEQEARALGADGVLRKPQPLPDLAHLASVLMGRTVSEHVLLDRILEPGSLSIYFQPVLELHGGRVRPHYFEALTRGPRGTSAETPTILFEYARKKSKESAVDRACVAAILDAAQSLPAGSVLGINVHASTLAMDTGFVDFLAIGLDMRGLSAARVVIEIVEHAPPWDVTGLHTALDGLRRLGVRIALDDVGLGHSNFLMILECRPDYLKIDRHFVDGCHRDFHRRAVLDAVTQLARSFGARVVAEGVEEPSDLTTLRRLGINLIQGFLLGRPVVAAEIQGAAQAPKGRGQHASRSQARR